LKLQDCICLKIKVENHNKVLKDILNALSELLIEAKENETKQIGFKV